jgi:hypothetical protein
VITAASWSTAGTGATASSAAFVSTGASAAISASAGDIIMIQAVWDADIPNGGLFIGGASVSGVNSDTLTPQAVLQTYSLMRSAIAQNYFLSVTTGGVTNITLMFKSGNATTATSQATHTRFTYQVLSSS